MMTIDWKVTAKWAGNLTNIPINGIIIDYKQMETGYIEVSVICTPTELPGQVALLANPKEPYCSGMTINPYFHKEIDHAI